MLVEDTGFVGPVPVAVTTVRLVREAEIQLRRPCLQLIPLELRTHSPRPITLVSLQGRLPNLHILRSPAIHNDSWMLRMRRLTGWMIHSPQVNKSSDHSDRKTSVMPNTLWRWVFGLCPRKDFSLSKASEVGCSQTTKAVH